MSIIPYRKPKSKPLILTILLFLLSILFPGWSIQASPKPRRFQHLSYETALSVSLARGYHSVRWEVL